MTGTNKLVRLSKAAREFNISLDSIVSFLTDKGYDIERKPNTKLDPEMYTLLTEEFQDEKQVKEISKQKGLQFVGKETVSIKDTETAESKRTVDIPTEEDLIIKNTGVSYDDTKSNVEHSTPKPVVPEEKEEPVELPTSSVETEKPVEEEEPVKEITKEIEPDIEEVISEDIPKEEVIAEIVTDTKLPEDQEIEVIEEKEDQETKDTEADDSSKVEETEDDDKKPGIKILDKINLDNINQRTRPKKKTKAEKKKELEAKTTKKTNQKKKQTTVKEEPKEPVTKSETTDTKSSTVKKDVSPDTKSETATETSLPKEEDNFIKTKVEKLTGPKILDKIDLPAEIKRTKKKKPVASSTDKKVGEGKKKRRRIKPKPQTTQNTGQTQKGKRDDYKKKSFGKKRIVKTEPTEEEIQQKIKDTLARLAPAGKSKAAKHRKRKRETVSQTIQEELQKQEDEKKILKVTEFVTANELATMMDIGVTDIITSCMQLGLFVSINQRLDAETIVLVAEEFGHEISFVSVDDNEDLEVSEEVDDPESLIDRSPIVTVMGHVDHGKTKLLDYIRKANVVSGEAGGITQHIGAYEVVTESGKKITFLDTPGHEAFTAMRARGAKVTDVAIIVIAADDTVMPQTKEAINHAQAAGVPIVFAINKMDKEGANAEKVKEQLANMNILVEDWGGKFQSQEISAITGMGINELLEKVLLESEMLELKANPNKAAKGTVIEASLDKGRGYVTTVLVQDGTLKKGDIILAGPVSGKVKAMFNERNEPTLEVGPSEPTLILGLISAPQAGDVFNGMKDEKEAKILASKRQQLIREQGLRTQKHLTLDEIGRRIAIGEFKELNVIVKGDVDGSIEALTDSLIKLSTEEVQVNVIHKAVGAISESDVMLASASDAIIIGFQVRPSVQARKLAEKEEIDIRLYSIIYQATEELETAIKGMLAPKTEEKITCNIEVRETFKITKVGTIAGCYVLDGKVKRNTKIRVIRDGIVVYTGLLGSLKRFKDDVKDVASGYECGLNIENFNDIKVGDIVEGYDLVEIVR